MKLKIVLDIETDPDKGLFIYGKHKPPFFSAKHNHAWLLDNDLVAEAIHETFEFYKNDYVTAEISYLGK